MNEEGMLLVGVSAACLIILAIELRAGVVGAADGLIRRIDSPPGFWIALVAQAACGLGLLMFAAMV